MQRVDLAVVGAGIGAASLVYHLQKLGFDGSVLVADRLDAVAAGPTAHSAGGCRNLWTTPINQRLCTLALGQLARFREELGRACGWRQTGYLFTYDAARWAKVPAAAELWAAHGVAFELWDPARMEARIPGLRCSVSEVDEEVRAFLGLEDLVGGVYGPDCGAFDPSQAAAAYFEAAARAPRPPRLLLNTEVLALRFAPSGRVEGLVLKGPEGAEEEVEAGLVALCTGPWTNALLAASGLPEAHLMPIAPEKRQLFVAPFPDADPRWLDLPLTVLDRGLYLKDEGGRLLVGMARQDAPPGFDTSFEPEYYRDEVNPLLQERIPAAAACRLQGGWADLYDTCTADHNAILGWHEEHPGLLLQVGYSGHGAMQSPAAGLCLAELVTAGRYLSVDCTPLRWSRFREGDLVRETIVI